MRQIYNLSDKLEVGDYARVLMSKEDGEETFDALVVRHHIDRASLINREDNLCGCDEAISALREESPFSEFQNSWEIYPRGTGANKNVVEWINTISDASVTLLGIYIENGSIKMVDGRVRTERVVDSTDFRKPLYETTDVYTGIHGYHAHHGQSFNQPVKAGSKPYRVGVELEVEFKNETEKNKFCKGKSNWFFLERDGSLGSYGVEIITVPIRPMDAKSVRFWEDLVNYLSPRAKSWNTSTCGLHVHIGREILGNNAEQKSETLGKLLYLYHHHLNDTSLNKKVFGRDRAYHALDGKTDVGNAAMLLGSAVLKEKSVKDKVKDSLERKSATDRYYDINLTNSATIEFRKGRGSINTSRICLVVEYCEKMVLYAKQARWENISFDDFVEYMKRNVKVTSPLRSYFEEF